MSTYIICLCFPFFQLIAQLRVFLLVIIYLKDDLSFMLLINLLTLNIMCEHAY